MNEYTYDNVPTGKENEISFQVVITDEMMRQFYALSGDSNPMHLDSGFAKMGGYLDKLVYGMLTASFYSKLVGVYLPGKYCLLQEVDAHFHNPVYVGDELTVSGYVKKKVELGRSLAISARIINQNNEKVGSAKIMAGCTR